MLVAGLVAPMALLTTSCTKPFEEINKNSLYPDFEMLRRDGVLNGAFMSDLQAHVIPAQIYAGTGLVNDYQVTSNLQADSWMGYVAPRDAKWPSRNLTQFYFDVGWTNGTFAAGITNLFVPWTQLKKLNYDTENKQLEIFSIAQISKIMGFHRTVDKYGAVPYFSVGTGSFITPYDAPADIYKSFFNELEKAVDVLHTYAVSGKTLVENSGDIVYEGNPAKWVKLGNSLMLRLAMRVRYVEPDLSRTWAEKALNHPGGLIESPDDNAFIKDKGGVVLRNSFYTIVEAYNDSRMGASIYSYLKGYDDPRLSKYFKGGKDIDLNVAIPPAIPQTGNLYNKAAKPNVGEFDQMDWFRSSEVAFLKAEAKLAGYNVAGTAEEHYLEGVKRSFAEHGISETELATYINDTNRPADFDDTIEPKYSATAPSTLTTEWDDSASDEVKLERIMIQKYLALYPDGTEAWSEWRRTGYPRLIPANSNISNFGVVTSDGHKDGVRSIPYPQSELNLNGENVRKAINDHRGGHNMANVNVWWDVKPKN